MTGSPFDQIQTAFAIGDLDEVERRIQSGWSRLGAWGQLTQPFRLAFHRGELVEAVRLAQRAVEAFPDRAYSYDMLALALTAVGRPHEALALCEAALARFPNDAGLLRRVKTAARKAERPDKAIEYLRRLIEQGDDGAETRVELGRLLLQTYRGVEALENLNAALARGAARPPLLMDLAMASERAGRFEAALDLWVELETEDPAQAALAREGRQRVERHLRSRAGSVRHITDMAELVEPTNGDEAIYLSPTGDLKAWRRPGGGDLVMVFGGLQAMMGVAPPSAPHSLIQLSRLNILSFNDPRRALMMAGVPSLGSDYAETLAGLKSLFDAWRIERVFVLGYSAGGYPALRYAVDLSAQRVVLMSGWIDLSLADQGPLVATLTDRVGHMYEPPRALMGRASNTQCVLAFGAENARDAAHARSLEDLRNVTLRPLIGVAGHGLAAEAAHDELIADLLGV